jgi:MoaA/NifB/PqqE/SkfB family radical SAM enzyme
MDCRLELQRIIQAAYDAQYGDRTNVVPYDPSRRKTRMERRARDKHLEKRKAVEKRKQDNERVIRSYNLKKGR